MYTYTYIHICIIIYIYIYTHTHTRVVVVSRASGPRKPCWQKPCKMIIIMMMIIIILEIMIIIIIIIMLMMIFTIISSFTADLRARAPRVCWCKCTGRTTKKCSYVLSGTSLAFLGWSPRCFGVLRPSDNYLLLQPRALTACLTKYMFPRRSVFFTDTGIAISRSRAQSLARLGGRACRRLRAAGQWPWPRPWPRPWWPRPPGLGPGLGHRALGPGPGPWPWALAQAPGPGLGLGPPPPAPRSRARRRRAAALPRWTRASSGSVAC